jgi:hypothetical protein
VHALLRADAGSVTSSSTVAGTIGEMDVLTILGLGVKRGLHAIAITRTIAGANGSWVILTAPIVASDRTGGHRREHHGGSSCSGERAKKY